MWNEYDGIDWSERVVNVGMTVLGGIASFVFFCLNNLRVIAMAILASIWFSAYWTMGHPKPPSPMPFVQRPGQPQP